MNIFRQLMNRLACWGAKPNSLDRLVDDKWIGGGSQKQVSDATQEPAIREPSLHSEWFCSFCHEEWIPEERLIAVSGYEHKRTVCFHCGCPLSQTVKVYWTFDEQGNKKLFIEV
jgi:hypothetical protein